MVIIKKKFVLSAVSGVLSIVLSVVCTAKRVRGISRVPPRAGPCHLHHRIVNERRISDSRNRNSHCRNPAISIRVWRTGHLIGIPCYFAVSRPTVVAPAPVGPTDYSFWGGVRLRHTTAEYCFRLRAKTFGYFPPEFLIDDIFDVRIIHSRAYYGHKLLCKLCSVLYASIRRRRRRQRRRRIVRWRARNKRVTIFFFFFL